MSPEFIQSHFKKTLFLFSALTIFNGLQSLALAQETLSEPKIEIMTPSFILTNTPFDITIDGKNIDPGDSLSYSLQLKAGQLQQITPDNRTVNIGMITGSITKDQLSVFENLIIDKSGSNQFLLTVDSEEQSNETRVIPGVLSVLPPILAILLALIFRQVFIALFCGIWLGGIFLNDYNIFTGLLRSTDLYLVQAMTDPDYVRIIIFTMTLGGMVGILAKCGGTKGIVEKLSKFAKSSVSGQLATWAMGMLIFFDDYSNALLVGNTMRPFTDKLKISREKLSYIVDSTSAPIASMAPISTWIGYELGLLNGGFQTIGIHENVYFVFLQTIPFRFYAILALIFVFWVALTDRDFGSMYRAEHRAYKTGKVLRDGAIPLSDKALAEIEVPEGAPIRWYNAMIPILTMILILVVGLYVNGKASLGNAAPLRDIIGAADSFQVLVWASLGGTLVAGFLAMSQRILNLTQTVEAFLVGFKAMLTAIIVLTLAKGIQIICTDLHTANYILGVSRDIVSPQFLPLIIFVISAFTSFATGTSWGTMAILIPLVVPLGYHLPIDAGLSESATSAVFLGSIGSVLSGSIFGDHCSPISDTTIMSSMASGSDHIDHVRTQLPYALIIAVISIAVGYLPVGFGFNPWLSVILGIALCYLVIRFLGKKVTAETAAS